VFAIYLAYRLARQYSVDHQHAFRALLPIAGFLTAITFCFLGLYLG
jgi:hypothetical protein